MKPVLTKETVAKALEALKAQGKKTTLSTLHAALGNRGSLSTLLKLKAEVEGVASSPADSPTGLNLFRELWSLATTEGRQQAEQSLAQAREELTALVNENERLDGIALAAEERAKELERAKASLETELHEVKHALAKEQQVLQAELLKATEQASQTIQKLAEERSAHAAELMTLRDELASGVRKAHELELELVRIRAVAELQNPIAKPQVSKEKDKRSASR
jgi:chromosome segregation ATPase